MEAILCRTSSTSADKIRLDRLWRIRLVVHRNHLVDMVADRGLPELTNALRFRHAYVMGLVDD